MKSKMPEDKKADIKAVSSRLIHKGMVWDLVAETFSFGDEELTREFIEHPGAVAVIAIDNQDRLLLLSQYRHPVKSFLLEIPAGLKDIPGESELECAKRELLEETSLEADQWSELIRFYTTPGGNSEEITIFVAKGIREVESGYVQTGEEKDMPKYWVPIAEAVQKVLNSEIKSPSAAVGIMAYALRNSIGG